MTRAKKSVFIFISVIFLLPFFQKMFKPFSSGGLDGYSEPGPRPVLSVSNWFSCDFQNKAYRHIDNSIGFRCDLVRLHNQIDFSCFSVPNAREVIIGKGDYLFEESYIKAVLGDDFIGEKIIEARVRQLRDLQARLWKNNRIFLLIIFPPDKGSFYPEYIPERYRKRAGKITNYQGYKQNLEKAGIHLIDFNQWFLNLKDTSRFVLYPKTGIHWSSWGSYLAIDSLIRYIHSELNIPLPRIILDTIELSSRTRYQDGDINSALNLIWNIPHPVMAYPVYHFERQSGDSLVSALFLGDSFYFTWAKAGYIQNLFPNQEFWYYDHEVYRGPVKIDKTAGQMDLLKTVFRQNLLIFIQTNAGYGNVGYGFVDRLLAAFDSVDRSNQMNQEK